MPYGNKITTSLHGRRLGLQRLTTAESGGSNGTQEYLVGPNAHRREVNSTSETTDSNLEAWGITNLSSAGTYKLDPPVPGVHKTINFSTGGAIVQTAGGETIRSTVGSTQTSIKPSTATGVGVAELVGFTTSQWMLISSGVAFTIAAST